MLPPNRAAPPMPSPRDAKKPRTAPTLNRLRVLVRKRPLSQKETDLGAVDIIGAEQLTPTPTNSARVTVFEPKVKVDMTSYTETHAFPFDAAYDESATNAEVFQNSAAPLVERAFAGQNTTFFAYGATGSGKTHTMMGYGDELGVYLLAAQEIFKRLDASTRPGLVLRVSCYEIYGGKVFDLLNGRAVCPVREDAQRKVNVVGLVQRQVADFGPFDALLREASAARSTAATGAHADSSRSHSILQMSLAVPAKPAKQSRLTPRPSIAPENNFSEIGKISFIDLAGTERGADTLTCDDRERRLEGAEINKSLLALKECIRGLDQGKNHVPFRGSKLTEVLRDSFVGDCYTVMMANVSPSSLSVEQTLNTLRYAATVHDLGSSGDSVPKPSRLLHSVSDMGPRGGAPAPLLHTASDIGPRTAIPEEPPLQQQPPLSARGDASGRGKPIKQQRRQSMLPAPRARAAQPAAAAASKRRGASPPPEGEAAPLPPPPPPAAVAEPPALVDAKSGRLSGTPLVSVGLGDKSSKSGDLLSPKQIKEMRTELHRVSSTPADPAAAAVVGAPDAARRVADGAAAKENAPSNRRSGNDAAAAPSPAQKRRLSTAGAHESPIGADLDSHRSAYASYYRGPAAHDSVEAVAARSADPAARRALLGAHRQYIAEAVGALDMHTTLMSEAEGEADLSNYAGAALALIKSEQQMLASLQEAMSSFVA